MQSGLHIWLLDNPVGWLLFDGIFYLLPLVYLAAFLSYKKWAPGVALLMLVCNWIYVQAYTLYPANSIESFTAWLLFPLLFLPVNLRSFYFVLHALRYYFLFFFASAAAWKFVQGGIFHFDQMSGVLLFQHKDYLATSPGDWYSACIYWFINHPAISYLLYAVATVCELFFAVGFFTRKLDRWLAFIFLLFLLSDSLIMRIPYWEITPFALTFFFSRHTIPGIETAKR